MATKQEPTKALMSDQLHDDVGGERSTAKTARQRGCARQESNLRLASG